MGQYNVFHRKDPDFRGELKLPFNEHYEWVASVETDSIDDVYRLTNHIDHDWQTNPEIIAVEHGPQRSTSVGDVVMDTNKTAWLVAPIGWTEVTIPEGPKPMKQQSKHWHVHQVHLEGEEWKESPKHPIRFRLYDDDDNLYFTGTMSQKLYDAGESIFAPLDFAMANYGCTYMTVLSPKTKQWEHV